jgi:uncharacterized membrane protein
VNLQSYINQLTFGQTDLSFAIVVGLTMIFAFIYLFGFFTKIKRTESQAVVSSAPGISIIIASRNALPLL